MKKFKQFVNENQEEIQFGQQTFTREEVISLLEDVYAEAAGSFNDYGQDASSYYSEAAVFVKKYMENR